MSAEDALHTIICCSCHIRFAVPQSYWQACQDDSRFWFYCPNGHRQHFTTNDFDEIRRERDRLKQENARLNAVADDWMNTATSAQRQVSAAKGQITKLKKRAQAGVCPCCNRTFSDLARHMQSKHKGFGDSPVELSA
jgi:hypothetical protein